MFCIYCGEQLEDVATFCRRCGQRTRSETAPAAPPTDAHEHGLLAEKPRTPHTAVEPHVAESTGSAAAATPTVAPAPPQDTARQTVPQSAPTSAPFDVARREGDRDLLFSDLPKPSPAPRTPAEVVIAPRPDSGLPDAPGAGVVVLPLGTVMLGVAASVLVVVVAVLGTLALTSG
jgi:hypothetical protein